MPAVNISVSLLKVAVRRMENNQRPECSNGRRLIGGQLRSTVYRPSLQVSFHSALQHVFFVREQTRDHESNPLPG